MFKIEFITPTEAFVLYWNLSIFWQKQRSLVVLLFHETGFVYTLTTVSASIDSFCFAPEKKKMIAIVVCLLFASVLNVSSGTSMNHLAIAGTSVKFHCNSSFPPPWAKIGPKLGDYTPLAMVGKRHPNFKDNRFTFSDTNTRYTLKIDNVKPVDAGNFRCDGDQPISYNLGVVRYVDIYNY